MTLSSLHSQRFSPKETADLVVGWPLLADFRTNYGQESPEEIIFDFGLNPQPVGVPKEPIVVSQRIVMNFYTAKRLAAVLQMSIDRHEQVFGTIETDVEKRIKSKQ